MNILMYHYRLMYTLSRKIVNSPEKHDEDMAVFNVLTTLKRSLTLTRMKMTLRKLILDPDTPSLQRKSLTLSPSHSVVKMLI